MAEDILDYVLREMTSPEGGFYSATDADSEGEEGKFFVWTPAEVREALGDAEAARLFCAAYDITEAGNFEGHGIPNRRGPSTTSRPSCGVARPELDASLAASRARLYEARAAARAARPRRQGAHGLERADDRRLRRAGSA